MGFRWWIGVALMAAVVGVAYAQIDIEPRIVGLPENLKSAPADPLTWQPPDTTVDLRRMMAEEQYQARKRTVWNNARRAGLDNPLYPRSGLRFLTVMSGGRAAKQGIRVGEIITSVNGNDPTVGDFTRAIFGTAPFTITVCKPGALPRDITFDAGKLQVDTEAFADFARMYWGGGVRNTRWDEDVVVAARECESDPELAETALAHARAAGWDDRLLDVLTCVIYRRERRFEEAVAAGLPLLKDLPKEVHAIVAQEVLDASRMCYHFQIAEQILKDYPDEVSDSLTDEFAGMAKWHRALPDELRISRPPVEIAAEAPSEDLTNSIQDISPLRMFDPAWKM